MSPFDIISTYRTYYTCNNTKVTKHLVGSRWSVMVKRARSWDIRYDTIR